MNFDLIAIFSSYQDSSFYVALGSTGITTYTLYKVVSVRIKKLCNSFVCLKIEFSNWKIELDRKGRKLS